MRFNPDYKLNIITEDDFPERIVQIEEELEPCRNLGYFDSFDGKKLYYEYFLTQNAKASIVVVHGLSEFTRKFYEITYYFLNQGFNVFLYDQRCHGLSCRLTDRIDLIHVDRFEDYAADLKQFINTVVTKSDDKPLYIYSHSMGGAVAALYLAENQDIEKAILSAPLLDPNIGKVPHPLAKYSTKYCIIRYGGTSKFRFSGEFNPETRHHNSSDVSKNRFKYNMQLRISNPNYQTTPLTVSWVYNSLIIKRKLLKRKTTNAIKTPMLLLSAEKDTVVKIPAQIKFAKRCKTCRFETIKDAKHSMFSGSDETIKEYLDKILAFYDC